MTVGGTVGDDFKLRATLPTLDWLLLHGAQVVVCSHLGRPGGKVDPRYAMNPVRTAMATIRPGVEVMENLRFDPGEESNDSAFVIRLIEGFDAYVNDAFGACHRSHASIVGPPMLLPSAAGRLLQREVEALERVLVQPSRPFVAIVGGAKVADKLGVLRSLAERADYLLLGGAMCFTFLAALGHEVGASHIEPTLINEARSLLATHPNIVLPTDFVALQPGATAGNIDVIETTGPDLAASYQGMDIGPDTRSTFSNVIARAGTVLWNGPMGVFEDPRFASGTRSVGEAVASSEGFTVVGGGDTVSAIHQFGLDARVGHLSTGGGATLELLEYGDLPGIAALRANALQHLGRS
jgi:phosphoglycerate kinase